MTCSKAGPTLKKKLVGRVRRWGSKDGVGSKVVDSGFTALPPSVLITCHRGRTSVDVLWMAVRLPGDNARLRPVVGIF